MKVEYRRDLQKSYLVLVTENKSVQENYDWRMITENQIEGLLSCERKLLNNDILYYYDVTLQCSLEDRCKVKKVQGQEILLLLNRILSVLDKLEEYLLSENALCILPQYIYMNNELEQINFCYVPGENWNFEAQLRELLEYLLPYLEHDNQESVMIGYGIYHYILREKFTIEGVYEQLNLYHRIHKEKILLDEQGEEQFVEEHIVKKEKNQILKDIWDQDEREQENDKKNSYWLRDFVVLIGLLWALGSWFLWRNFRTFLWIWGIVGGGIAVSIMFIYFKWFHKKEEYMEIKENKTEETESYTQVLNISSVEKSYILKNENNVIPLKDKECYIIGRDKNVSDIVLPSNAVSRRHAQIRLTTNSCFLKDLHSKNGIRVKGIELVRGEEVELFGGELIQFADISYYFQREN